jgi:peptidyl-prolyl cis-trans isomerase D
VNGETIPVEMVRRAWQDRQNELQQIARDELPDEVVKSEQQRLLEEFVRRELLLQRANELGYRVSDRDLVRALEEVPSLQVDGKFSRDRYAALLRAQGRTEAAFEADFRRDLEVAQLHNGLALSTFALPGELRRRIALQGEMRDVDLAVVPAARFAEKVTISEQDVIGWYEKHKPDYQTPEAVTLQFVRLDLADVASGIKVTEEGLRQHYDQIAAERYVTAERRHARHILVESGSDDAAARARAEALAERARGGEDFAALAAQNSDDPGSKGQGGDLGWATRDSFVAPFADAMFTMAAGEIRGPVKTQFGYHLIKLEEIESGHQRSFEEVRDELDADFRREEAQAGFYERSQQLADEAFASLSELDSVAKKLGLELRTLENFTRARGGEPLGADPELIKAAFSDEVLIERQNSPAIKLGEESVVVLRVTDHRPSTQRPLEEVRGEVEAGLRAERARDAAQAAVKDAASKLAAGGTWGEVTVGLGVQPAGAMTVARSAENLPADLRKAIFAVAPPESSGSRPGTALLPSGDAVLFLVSGVRPGSMAALDAASRFIETSQEAAGRAATAEFAAYVAELERTAKVTRNPKLFE